MRSAISLSGGDTLIYREAPLRGGLSGIARWTAMPAMNLHCRFERMDPSGGTHPAV